MPDDSIDTWLTHLGVLVLVADALSLHYNLPELISFRCRFKILRTVRIAFGCLTFYAFWVHWIVDSNNSLGLVLGFVFCAGSIYRGLYPQVQPSLQTFWKYYFMSFSIFSSIIFLKAQSVIFIAMAVSVLIYRGWQIYVCFLLSEKNSKK